MKCSQKKSNRVLAKGLVVGLAISSAPFNSSAMNVDIFKRQNNANIVEAKNIAKENGGAEKSIQKNKLIPTIRYNSKVIKGSVLEVVLGSGDIIPDLTNNPDGYETIKVTTTGGKKLSAVDFSRLKESKIPNIDLSKANTEVIPNSAFKDSKHLISFKFPSGVIRIEDRAFYNCLELAGKLIIPNSVNFIGEDVFTDSESMDSIVIKIEEADKSINYRKSIIDKLPAHKTVIEMPYEFNTSGTWLNNTNKRIGKPIIKDIISNTDNDLINNKGERVSLYIPTPYIESDITVTKDGNPYILPTKNPENKHIFFEDGVYNIKIITGLGTVSNVDFTVEPYIWRWANEAVGRAEISRDPVDIENARDEINKLPEAWLKDEFQDRLNDIQIDSFIEREVTSNLDVYIKSENILSLSVDTNSVIFKEFSGVEDVERLNAVNLNVSSSLPYELNACLPVEIIGTSGAIMDKEIINVRANGEALYNSFTDLNTPVNLLDNQLSGNGKIHGVDINLKGGLAHTKDNYKSTIKFEVNQK